MISFASLKRKARAGNSLSIFRKSSLGRPLSVREQPVLPPIVSLDFSTPYKIEETVYQITNAIGFNPQKIGTRFFNCIIARCVNDGEYPLRISDFYKIAVRRFTVTQKTVEVATNRALQDLTLTQLKKINDIVGCEIIRSHAVTVGDFLTSVCSRLILLKSHANGETYFITQDRA